jgi:ankyrin repeat protein
MPMPINLIAIEVAEIQKRYHYLINYEGDDPTAPIDPLTYTDSNGDHLLHIAAQCGDLRTIELLIKAGLDVNKEGDMGCTALHYAKLKRKDDIARFLLANGASTSIRNDFGQLPGEE